MAGNPVCGPGGIRLTAAPVGDEIRIDRIFLQNGLANEFDEPWHQVFDRRGGQPRPLAGLGVSGFFFPEYWKPKLRAARAEPSVDLSDNPFRTNYRELHCATRRISPTQASFL